MATNPEAHLPVDKSVILPEAVRNAGAVADALMAAQAPAPPTGQAPPPAGTMPIEVPTGPAPPPAGFTQPAPLPAQVPVQPQPVAQPQVQPQVQVDPLTGQLPPSAPPGSAEATWEHRYRSMRGRYDVDTRRLQGENQSLRSQVDDLMRRAPPAGTPVSPNPAQPITFDAAKRAELEQLWGKEMADSMIDVASSIAASAMGQVSQRVDTTMQQTQQEMWGRANEAMQASLDQMFPEGPGIAGWQTINNDDAFKIWLQARDGFSSLTRHQVLLDAWNRNDLATVSGIFAGYISQQPLPAGGTGPLPTPNGNPGFPGSPQPSNRIPMHQLAAPGPARAAPPAQQPGAGDDRNFYRQSEVAKFFQDKARGIYNDTPARMQWAAGIEVDIFAAQKEGRVVPG